jgi:hypothetical protein
MKLLFTRASLVFALLLTVVAGLLCVPEVHAAIGAVDPRVTVGMVAGITLDIFRSDVFKTSTMTAALRRVPYLPQFISAKNLFQPKPLRTEDFWLEMINGKLRLIQTTPRGAPAPQQTRDKRNARAFSTVRIAKDDVIRASELLGVRDFGEETALMQVQREVLQRQEGLRRDYLLTREYQQLGALQGKVLDADGTVIEDFYDAFDIAEPTPIVIDISDLNADDGAFRQLCADIRETMWRKGKGSFLPNSRVGTLCGTDAFNKIIKLKEVRDSYKGYQAAAELRGALPDSFEFGGILWEKYIGTDPDQPNGHSVNIADDEIKFYPINAPGVFEVAYSPGEKFDHLGTLGQEYYAYVVPDKPEENEKADLQFRAYQLPYCTNPEMLASAVVQD